MFSAVKTSTAAMKKIKRIYNALRNKGLTGFICISVKLGH